MSPPNNPRRSPARILIVDDKLDGRLSLQRALKKTLPPDSAVNFADSGNQAIAYMIGEGVFKDRKTYPFPTLVITEIAIAPGDGFDVLEFMQFNPAWSVVPRIVLSSSENDDDVRTAFLLGASAYHVKPEGSRGIEELLHNFVKYWASSKAPPVDANGRLILTVSTGRRGARYAKPVGSSAMKRPATSQITSAEAERRARIASLGQQITACLKTVEDMSAIHNAVRAGRSDAIRALTAQSSAVVGRTLSLLQADLRREIRATDAGS